MQGKSDYVLGRTRVKNRKKKHSRSPILDGGKVNKKK